MTSGEDREGQRQREMMGEHGNCEAGVTCCSGFGHSCALEAKINEVCPGSRDSYKLHECCETSVTLLYCSAVNALHHKSIA